MLSVNIFPVKFLNKVHPSMFCPIKNCVCMLSPTIVYVPYILAKHLIVGLLNQAHTWFLEITFVRTSVCMCVCVRPRAIKNYSHEMKSE